MAAQPVISEILASNSTGIIDGYGAHSDWIEIHNQGDASMDLAGWHLTDDPSSPAKWTFPSHTLSAGQYMIVFASGKNAIDPAGNIHTNFSLSAAGENVSLRQPDGTLVSEIATGGTSYPPQVADVSYGPSKILNSTPLISTGATAKAFVPTNSSLDSGVWTTPGYSDSTWTNGTTGVGFDGGGTAPTTGLLANWSADALNGSLASGASVSSWGASTGTGTATQSTSANQPKLIKSALNGHSVVRFDGSNDQLKITNQSLNGDANFTVAVVFRTSTAGHSGTEWYNNTGIVDAEIGGVTNDWGVTMNDAGAIGAGVGNPDTTLYSASGLNNGLAHIAIFTKNGTKTALSIDGGAPSYGTVSASNRTVNQLTFGSINTNLNYFNGDIGQVMLYSSALSDDSARSLSTTLASTWGVTAAAGVYTPLIGLNLQSAMSNTASTADIRIPFTVNNPSQYDTLTLGMEYDDGFVAYLNGTEVARRNAPSGTITYTSTATVARDDTAAQTPESIDISQFANLLVGGGATNVLAIKALNVSSTDSDLLINPTLTASISSTGMAYMTTPTPGAANLPGYAGIVSPVTFSKPHGYYAAATVTQLTTATRGATIVYTTDGSDPTLTNGTVVSAPDSSSFAVANINLSSTTVLRAAAFLTSYLPSAITAASYMFTADIIRQPESTPSGAYWDVGLNQTIVNSTQTYSVAQALTAIPSISLSLPNADMFGSNGIYTNPEQRGDAWERETSVEYFDPNNASNQFTINAGIRVEGGVSRDPSRPKKAFKLYFRGSYGASTLDYPIFGMTDPEQSFDHLELKSVHSYSWANLGGEPANQADYLRDQFARDTQLAITGKAARGNWIQLYINGQYWGLYNVVEAVDTDFASANYGGKADDYDLIEPDGNGGIELQNGTLDTWNTLFNTADTASADGIIDSTEYANISSKVDTKGLVDYMLNVFYRGDQDAPVLIGSTTSPRNFLAFDNPVTGGKYEFQTWDGEISLNDVNFNRTTIAGNQNPARLYQQLLTNNDFKELVADETQRLFNNGGPLTVAANQARYQSEMSTINVAIVGESARWGDFNASPAMTRDDDWVPETNWIVNTYMPARTAVVLNQLKSEIPSLTITAPTINVNGNASTGGSIALGAPITFTNSNSSGSIYYTLDGTDPRASGDAISSTAISYSGSAFTINQDRTINVRVVINGTWSPLTTAAFTLPYALRVSEINYHPAAHAGVTDPEDQEFLELLNASNQTLSLAGASVSKAFDYTFPAGTTLAGGAYIVIPRNASVFQTVYGTSINLAPGAGYTPQNLSNSGEEIVLKGPSGELLEDFTYSDHTPWPSTPDGSGPTLEAIDPTADPSNAANWRASAANGGSPGSSGLVSPTVTASSFSFQAGNTISFTFSQDMNTSSFQTTDLAVQLTSGGTILTPASFTWAAATKTLTFTFASVFADGVYTATLAAGSVSSAAGAALATAYSVNFFALAGDANHDGKVDIADLGILATNYGNSSATFATGDFNHDGKVDIGDLGILATNYGKAFPV